MQLAAIISATILQLIKLLLQIAEAHFLLLPMRASEQSKVIGVGVHIYVCLWRGKKIKSYFSDRITFSNIRGRTSRRIYRQATAFSKNVFLIEEIKDFVIYYAP